MKKLLQALFFILSILMLSTTSSLAVMKTSTGTGTWSMPGTWDPSGVPAIGDDVTIAVGHTVTVDVNTANAIASLTVNGTLTVGNNNTNRTVIVSGNVVVNTGGTFQTAGDGG